MFDLLGKLIALPIRIVNAPARAIEILVYPDTPSEDRVLSRPLDAMAKAIEEATEDNG